MTKVAILSRLQYDAHVRVIDIDLDSTMDEVAAACAAPAIGYQARHPDPSKPLRVRLTAPDDGAAPFPRDMKAGEANFKHFECVDIFVE